MTSSEKHCRDANVFFSSISLVSRKDFQITHCNASEIYTELLPLKIIG